MPVEEQSLECAGQRQPQKGALYSVSLTQCLDIRVQPCGLLGAQDTFRIGIFSSASQRTVSTVIPMLEAAARSGGCSGLKAGKKGPKLLPERAFILTRQHTDAAPTVPLRTFFLHAHWLQWFTCWKLSSAVLCVQDHVANGGKDWDTVKPLSKWFRHMDRVILVDDDAFKVESYPTWALLYFVLLIISYAS